MTEDEGIEIHSEVFDKDFDDVGFEPEVVEGDNDEELEELYGLNK